MKFSDRKGITSPKKSLQRDSMDRDLQIAIWNVLDIVVFSPLKRIVLMSAAKVAVFDAMWLDYFKLPLDGRPDYGPSALEFIRERFFGSKWYEVYNFAEWCAQGVSVEQRRQLEAALNPYLERELSAYRLVQGEFVEITSDHELQAIDRAFVEASALPGVRTHLRRALELLSDRENPDYRNSIKESVSAVESIARVIVGSKSASLGAALKRLTDGGVALHPALEAAWLKLYGFSSDEGGIRHALLDEPRVTGADARFMLVTCSAFISHLIELAADARVSLK